MSDARSRPALAEVLAAEIRRSGPISFARFMERALYEPGVGYYARSAGRLGRGGDYFTAADVGTAFGECLARQTSEMDALLGRPDPFAVLEFGAGRGILARDLLDALAATSPDLGRRARTVLIDVSRAMREEASGRVPEAEVVSPGEAGTGHVGLGIAVELFDALPVHRVRRSEGRIREVFVDVDAAGNLVEREADPLPQSLAMALRYGATPGEGDEAEVCPAALEQLDAIERCFDRGFLVLVDYGYDARELYGRAHRRGTLLAYLRHSASEAYLERVGEQDLTAHVNFTALEDRARERGLLVLSRTTQDRFLIANGVLARFQEEDPARWRDPSEVRRRLLALQLIHPQGMGRIFKVLVLSKGVDPPPSLRGLEDPFGKAERGH